jgi:dTDP-4-dehydrorhamnose reductase
LWEKLQPDRNTIINWLWTDRQLDTIRDLGITPVAGLLHYGSGPSFTNLLDPEFPNLMASYAYEVANRYPWIENYVPINEPLTSALFSGLYGHWYPHHRSEHSFYRMLLNQLKATVLCMDAIHSVNPAARLIQTEGLGKTYSTPLLSYQADFENHRRLLTYDILTGRLIAGHPLYHRVVESGITENEIHYFQEHRTAPDILGLNFSVDSERWLDESYEKFDTDPIGFNGIHRYADTELAKAGLEKGVGFKKLATEMWERYQLPLAITKANFYGTKEAQLRWFKEIWDHSIDLTNKAIPVKAVTSWDMLGSSDRIKLPKVSELQYQSGVFDSKTFPDKLRPTALAKLVKNLAAGKNFFHPVIATASQPILIIINNPEDEDCISVKLRMVLEEAFGQRNIPTLIINHESKIDFLKLNPWAVINLGPSDKQLRSVCADLGFQFVSFTSGDPADSYLRILIQQTDFTVYQMNKLLDLIIDGESGCWAFRSGELIFRTENRLSVALENPLIS